MAIYIEQLNDNYEYEIQLTQSLNESKEKPVTNLPLPGEPAESNIPLAFEGETKTIDVTFILYDDGTDKSRGTAPGGVFTDDTVETIPEQKQYLEQYIHKENLNVNWELNDTTGKILYKTWPVALETIDFKTQSENPLRLNATMKMKVGQGV